MQRNSSLFDENELPAPPPDDLSNYDDGFFERAQGMLTSTQIEQLVMQYGGERIWIGSQEAFTNMRLSQNAAAALYQEFRGERIYIPLRPRQRRRELVKTLSRAGVPKWRIAYLMGIKRQNVKRYKK